MHGFHRIAAFSPELKVADVDWNTQRIIECASAADDHQAAVALFPELSITGYTCADLFHQESILKATERAIERLRLASTGKRVIIIAGAPLAHANSIYNCAVVIQNGAIIGIVPKSFLPSYREFYEPRWFSSGMDIHAGEMDFSGGKVPFGSRLVFTHSRHFSFSVEICEDLWAPIPPSSWHAIAGALITFNPSASNDLVGKAGYRRDLVAQQSARCVSAYVYASSGVHESTQDLVFGGHLMVAENGRISSENQRFKRGGDSIYADIDCQRLAASRFSESSMPSASIPGDMNIRHVQLSGINSVTRLQHCHVDPHPFVPSSADDRNLRCQEIFNIQCAGLAKRLEHAKIQKAVIGISGGLDSTLALLVCSETFKLIGRKPADIIAVTMPGFGTTSRTHNNAAKICELLDTGLREIDIRNSCLAHFKDIGHDPDTHDVTYENVQARERTRILMNIANRENGIVIGTGDLSEIALGWSTYNGDHMSMYAVNCGVPKTLIRHLIQWQSELADPELAGILTDIADTPVSPELLPNDPGNQINQRTEDIIGPYELHDFFLYHIVKYGAAPDKVLCLAALAFKEKYPHATLVKWLKLFISRFFSQQFKRSCIPDGPKVGTICLSPRGDWRMPSDASCATWLDSL